MHNELEASLKSVEEQLTQTSSELEKQKALNEKLENDLLAINKHKLNGNGRPDGALSPAAANESQSDLLVGLELGKKSTVGVLYIYCKQLTDISA